MNDKKCLLGNLRFVLSLKYLLSLKIYFWAQMTILLHWFYFPYYYQIRNGFLVSIVRTCYILTINLFHLLYLILLHLLLLFYKYHLILSTFTILFRYLKQVVYQLPKFQRTSSLWGYPAIFFNFKGMVEIYFNQLFSVYLYFFFHSSIETK